MQEDRDVFQMYLDEMAEIPACGAEENRRLWQQEFSHRQPET